MDINEEWDAVLSQNREEEIRKLTVSAFSPFLIPQSQIKACCAKGILGHWPLLRIGQL